MVSIVSLCGRNSKNLVSSGPNATFGTPEGDHLRRGPGVGSRSWSRASPEANRFMWKLRTSSCLSLAKLTVDVEPVDGDFGILAALDDVAVGITHVAAPFPAVIV